MVKRDYDGMIYVGKTFTVRDGVTIEHGRIYPVAIISPDFGFTYFQLEVFVGKDKVYLPYGSTGDIFEEWMPHVRRRQV